jgi:ribonuclease HI
VWVTCYTDASYRRGDGGSWAVWLRCSEGRIVTSGVCPAYVKESNAAELAAIFAGIYTARKSWPSTSGVLVCSDSQIALLACAFDSPLHRNPALRRLQERIRDVGVGIEIRTKWVKGHQPSSTGAPAWLNNRCDALAKQRRRRQRVTTSAVKSSGVSGCNASLDELAAHSVNAVGVRKLGGRVDV